MEQLLEAGVHFGHQTQKWDPRMKPYIFGERRGIHIINLEHTVPLFVKARQVVEKVVAKGGDILFVGNKRQAQPVIQEQALRCKMHYVNNRWLGGTLTNFKTIQQSIKRLKDLEEKMEDGSFDAFKKKERRQFEREIEKLRKSLGGIKNMDKLPALLFIIDPRREQIAIKEANRLNIPVVAVTDTNCNPEAVDYVIPGNDDAIKSIRVFARSIADACLTGVEKREVRIREEVAAKKKAAVAKAEKAPEVKEVVPEKSQSYVNRAIKQEEVEVDPSVVASASPEAAKAKEPEVAAPEAGEKTDG